MHEQLEVSENKIRLGETLQTSYWVVEGADPTLIFLHGLGTMRNAWKDVAGRLRDGGHAMIACDLRGSGDSTELETTDLSLDAFTDDLQEFIATLNLSEVVLVGHSLGAGVALSYAHSYGGAVRGLILIGADAWLGRDAESTRMLIQRIRDVGFVGWVNEFWLQNPPFSKESLARSPDAFARYRDMVLANSEENYVRTCEALIRSPDLSPHLPGIDQPALVIIGGKDNRYAPAVSWEIVGQMPHATGAEIPDVGHAIHMEAPGETAELIRAFLNTPGGRTPGTARRGAAR